MAKIEKIEKINDGPDYQFYCPACHCHHGVWTTESNNNHCIWAFNNDMEKPTIKPSIRVQFPGSNGMVLCHSMITDGKIAYCGDCTHELAGKTVEMEDI